MKHSVGKRFLAVLLCVAVFAGSELTGLTNVVGDLFAETTTTEADAEAPLDYATENVSVQSQADDAGVPEDDGGPLDGGDSGQSEGDDSQLDSGDNAQSSEGTGGSGQSGADQDNTDGEGKEDGGNTGDGNTDSNDNVGGADADHDDDKENIDSKDDDNVADENQDDKKNPDEALSGDKEDGDNQDGDTSLSGGTNAPADEDTNGNPVKPEETPALEENVLNEENTAQESATPELAEEKEAALAKAKSAEVGTLQEMITANEEEAVIDIQLTKDYKENLIIPDEKTVTIDLNGHQIQAVPEEGAENDTVNMITVYGNLILQDTSEGGFVTCFEGADNVRGVLVASGGNFELQGGVITGFHITGNGAGVRVEENGHFAMKGGAVRDNTASDGYGGGVFTYNSDGITLTTGEVSQNTAEYGGGLAVNLISAEKPLEIEEEMRFLENAANTYGGGLYFEEAESLTIGESAEAEGPTIERNTAPSGGGIWFAAVQEATLQGFVITDNEATDGNGGGVSAGTVMTLNIKGGRISGNKANAGNGGGIGLQAHKSVLHIESCEISNNEARTHGGGLALVNTANNGGVLTIEDSVITENRLTGTVQGLYGAGIMAGQYSDINITGTEISGNSGATSGGGLFVWNYSNAHLTGCTVSGNSVRSLSGACYGGGIYHGPWYSSTEVKLALTDTIVENNYGDSERSYGGGIYSNTYYVLEGASEVRGNKAHEGGGIYGGTGTLKDTANVRENTATGSHGGGLYGTVTMEDQAAVENNTSSHHGGGIFGTTTLTGDAKVKGNTATGTGGGIYGTTTISENAAVEENTSKSEGGGIYGTVTMSGGFVRNNTSSSNGGGIRTSSLVMSDGEISGNTGVTGGGVFIFHSGKVEITGGKIVDNRATSSAGGIYIRDANKYFERVIENVIVQGNTAKSNGGGIWVGWWTDLTLRNVTLTDNHAGSNGGGLYTSCGYVASRLDQCTVSGNDAAGLGRDVFASGTHELSYMENAVRHHAILVVPPASKMQNGTERSVWIDEINGEKLSGGVDNTEAIKALETEIWNPDSGKWQNCSGHAPDIALTFYELSEEDAVAQIGETIFTSVQEAVDSLKEADPDADHEIQMLRDSWEDVVIPEGTVAVLDLNGKTLRGMVSSVITVKKGAELTVQDSSEAGTGTIWDGKGTRDQWGNGKDTRTYGGGLFIEGTVVMSGGVITKNDAQIGAGVYIANGGVFRMEDGKITANIRDAGVYIYAPEQGHTDNGGGTFEFSGGEISANAVRGVTMRGHYSQFSMSGGKICDHNSNNNGTGVWIGYSWHFEMTGGEICNNTTNNAGGGLYVGNTPKIDLLGGSITGNKSTSETAAGAGIYYIPNQNNRNTYLNLEGTQVYGNYAGLYEREIYLREKTYVKYLAPAKEMGQGWECWYDFYNNVELTGAIEDQIIPKAYSLSGAMLGEDHTPAVRVGEKKYLTIAQAAEQIKAGETGDDKVIYLLRDVKESVALTKGTDVTVDLNGYTLASRQSYVFKLDGAKLVLRNTWEAEDKNKENIGKVVPGEGLTASRAVYIRNESPSDETMRSSFTMENVTISGFQGATDGGAILALGPVDVTIKGGVIENCSATGSGGAILMGQLSSANCLPYHLEITGAALRNNTAKYYGGAVAATTRYAGSSGMGHDNRSKNEIHIEQTCFENNFSEYSGGALYFNGWDNAGNQTEIEISDTQFTGNRAGEPVNGRYDAYGGGVAIWRPAKIRFDQVDFTQNTSIGHGGGLYLYGIADRTHAEFTGCNFTENQTGSTKNGSNPAGGGLCVERIALSMNGCKVEGNHAYRAAGAYIWGTYSRKDNDGNEIPNTIIDCQFLDNTTLKSSGGDTGGLYLGGRVNMTDVDIKGNRAYTGGGLYLARYRGTLSDVRIEENTATGGGGGVFIYNSNTGGVTDPSASNWYEADFENCKIQGNKASNGAGILGGENGQTRVRLRNTRITDNVAGNGDGGGIRMTTLGNRQDGIWRGWLYLEEGTVLSGNRASGVGGAIGCARNDITMDEGVVIKENTAGTYGGAIYVNGANLTVDGGLITKNTADYGGAVCVYTDSYEEDESGQKAEIHTDIKGGRIVGNTAKQDGGAIYMDAWNPGNTNSYGNDAWVNVNLTGGEIADNRAGNRGGGVFVDYNNTLLNLQEYAMLYDNRAKLGQDIYAAYNGTFRNNRLDLVEASRMFPEGLGLSRSGVAWLDEVKNSYIETAVRSTLIRYYALTLTSKTEKTVAYAGTTGMTSVQAAVDYAVANKDACTLAEEEKVLVTLAEDVRENVTIPAEFDGVLNLNGYTLRGYTTAVDCYGQVRICDEQPHTDLTTDESAAHGKGTGTITGSAPEFGGGVRVRSGGYAVLESGQLSGCRAAANNTGSAYGGAAVCVDSGTFELTGEGVIRDNRSRYGAAVYVRSGSSRFLMTGGEITGNTAEETGMIFNNGGMVQITGGSIYGNTAKYAGAIYSNKTVRIAGGETPVQIYDNKASVQGGAIYQENGTITLSNVILHGNQVTGAKTADVTNAAGGAIYQYYGKMTISDGTIIYGNRAVRGGAIYQRGASTGNRSNNSVRMLGGLITKNKAQMGGGVAQYPEGVALFQLVRGGVYDNRSVLSGAGNDFYSRYEGTKEDYGTNTTSILPGVTLPAAFSMDTKYYNVWRDDSFSFENGGDRLAAHITKGQYITANIVDAFNVQLTAARYNTSVISNLSSDMKVTGLSIAKRDDAGDGNPTSGLIDGYTPWDSVADQEKTAKQMLDAGESGYRLSEETYEADNEVKNYIEKDGECYEQEQMVAWSPGDDSGCSNGLVRTFDTVTYEINTALASNKDQTSEEGEGQKEESVPKKLAFLAADVLSGGAIGVSRTADAGDTEADNKVRKVHVWMEVLLPCEEEKASFITDSLSMDAYTVTPVTEEGAEAQLLQGYWEKEVQPAGEMFQENIQIRINGARNGDTIKPVFKAWVEGNKENQEHPAGYTSRILTISAAAEARYNVSLDYNNRLACTGYFDLATGERSSRLEMETNENVVYGTMLGYGMMVELCNDSNGKGLKGIETSTSSLEFDLNMKGSLYLDGKELTKDGKPIRNAPYIWAYKENTRSDTGIALNGINYDRNMNWNDSDDVVKTTSYAGNAAPFNSGNSGDSCYSGGSWRITGEQPAAGAENPETTVHVKVSGYQFDYSIGRKPKLNSDGTVNKILDSDYVRAFTAGYLQVLYPLKDEDVAGKNGYLTIAMDAAITGFRSTDETGEYLPDVKTYRSDEDLQAMADYYGVTVYDLKNEDYAVNEQMYADNCSSHRFGMYVYAGGGDGESMSKNNYFLKEDKGAISGEQGDGNTPLDSKVYISATAGYRSKEIRLDDPKDSHYIENPDPQKYENPEYNYMTALNVLQKFDARAYTPVETRRIVNEPYTYDNALFKDGSFSITTSEEKPAWTEGNLNATRSCDLTILYGAKPDGTNWTIRDLGQDRDDGGVEDMSNHQEENLLFFETMKDLKAYFKQAGINEDAKCVAILYEFRNACIRKDRSITTSCQMQVTDDFDLTGGTYCTTNSLRWWSTYRPYYKEHDRGKTLDTVLYRFRWEDLRASGTEETGVNVYGAGLPVGDNYERENKASLYGYDKYFEVDREGPTMDYRMYNRNYGYQYIKTQYANGSTEGATHNGWINGNTLLLYTMDSSIYLRTADELPGSNGKYKQSYDIGRGERIVNFQVTPSLSTSSSVTDQELITNGTQKTEITVELILPKNLNYREGSVRFDYSDKKCGYNEGDLKWTIARGEGNRLILKAKVNDIDRVLPRINYSCEIGDADHPEKDPVSGASLTSIAKVYATYEETGRLASKTSESRASIAVMNSNANSLILGTGKLLTEIGENLEYTLRFTNKSEQEASGVEICDVLPYVGDGRGTSFHGGYRVAGIRVKFSDAGDFNAYRAEANQASMLKAVSGKTVPKEDEKQKEMLAAFRPDTVAGMAYTIVEGAENTVEMTVPETLTQSADLKTGIALYAKLPKVTAQKGVSISILLSPMKSESELLTDQKGGRQIGKDTYVDSCFYGKDGAVAYSNQQTIKVVDREVTGTVWLDQNHDGIRSRSEKRLSGIDVVLMKEENGQWVQAEDLLGYDLKTVTGPDGMYRFENLSAGEYQIWFRDDGNDYQAESAETLHPLDFGQLSVTARDSVRPNIVNLAEASYGEPEGQETLAPLGYARIGEVKMPEPGQIQMERYTEAYQDCGLYYTDLTLVKRWENQVEPIKAGTGAVFELTGAYGGRAITPAAYTFIQRDKKVEVKAGDAVFERPVVVKDENRMPNTVTWTLEHLALQAESADGKVTYACREVKAFGTGADQEVKDLAGYQKTEETFSNPNTGEVIFTAWNRQILCNLGVTKIKKGAADTKLSGAGFSVYLDEECTTAYRTGKTGSADVAVTDLLYLPAGTGTYYVRETKAPTGYALNAAVFRVEVTCKDLAGTSGEEEIPVNVNIYQISDEVTGEKLASAKLLYTSDSSKLSAGEAAELLTLSRENDGQYKIAFSVEDEVLYSLPSTGGSGAMSYRVIGLLILLLSAGIYEYYRRRRGEVA